MSTYFIFHLLNPLYVGGEARRIEVHSSRTIELHVPSTSGTETLPMHDAYRNGLSCLANRII